MRRSDLAGQTEEELFDVTGFVSDVAVDHSNSRLFWIDSNNDILYSANFDGSDLQEIITNIINARYLVLDTINETIYWTNRSINISENTLESITYTGADRTTVSNSEVQYMGWPAYDYQSQIIYWTEGEFKLVYL